MFSHFANTYNNAKMSVLILKIQLLQTTHRRNYGDFAFKLKLIGAH